MYGIRTYMVYGEEAAARASTGPLASVSPAPAPAPDTFFLPLTAGFLIFLPLPLAFEAPIF